MSILYLGGTIFIQEKFDEHTVLQTIEQERITYTMLVPLLCKRLLRCESLGRFKTSSLRYLGITGGHLSPELARNIRAKLCPELYEAYASTDCGQINFCAALMGIAGLLTLSGELPKRELHCFSQNRLNNCGTSVGSALPDPAPNAGFVEAS